MKQYVITLAVVLGIALVLNAGFTAIYGRYTGVAIATTITYYIWFFIGLEQFRFIKLTIKDIFYLCIYTLVFFALTAIKNDIIGFFIYLFFIVALDLFFYRHSISRYIKIVQR